jgi:hypothetical protein
MQKRPFVALFLLLAISSASAEKRVSCPDGDHIEIDVNTILIRYSGTGFTATLSGLSKLQANIKVDTAHLQEAAAATQQWNQLIGGLTLVQIRF